MRTRIAHVPPQVRAGIAAVLAIASIEASGDQLVDAVLALAWVVGGVADWWMTRRRPDAELSLAERQRRLQEEADAQSAARTRGPNAQDGPKPAEAGPT